MDNVPNCSQVQVTNFPAVTNVAVTVAGSLVSNLNSTIGPLGPNETWKGTPEDVSQYASISVALYVQPTSATGNLLLQFSNSASPWVPISNTVNKVTSAIASGFIFDTTMQLQFFRVIYHNDSTQQTALTVQTIYHPQARIAAKTARLAEPMNDYTDTLNTRALLWGKTNGGNIYEQVASNGENSLVTAIADPRTAFGELSCAMDTPTDQVDFVYGINPQLVSNVLSNNGAVGWYLGMANVSTGSHVNSSAILVTKRYVKYRPGQGAKSRFTAMFSTPYAGSVQIAGQVGNGTDGIGFGFNGTSFGILYRCNGSDLWIPQAQWNYDTMLGGTKSGKVLDPLKLNVYQLKFQYLGGGNIWYYVLNDFDGRWVLVHMIHNAGTLVHPNLRNPSMPFAIEVINTTSSNLITVSTASIGQFLEGTRSFLGPKGGLDSFGAVAATTLTNMIALHNASSFNGIQNFSIAHMHQIALSGNDKNNTTAVINLRIIKNPVTSLVYVPFNGASADGGVTVTGQSTISSNVSGVTVTGGLQLFSMTCVAGSSETVDVTGQELLIFPGDTLAFCVLASASVASVGISVSWNEDI
jgi:hypothetical protein